MSIDFTKCPNRTRTCTTAAYCSPNCRHAPEWFARPPNGLDMDHAPDVEAYAQICDERADTE